MKYLIIFLHLAEIPIVNQKICADAYKDVKSITARMICAGQETGGKDSCQGMNSSIDCSNLKLIETNIFLLGDSGGPLTVLDQNKTPLLVGVWLYHYPLHRIDQFNLFCGFFSSLDHKLGLWMRSGWLSRFENLIN